MDSTGVSEDPQIGDSLTVNAYVSLGGLNPDDVSVPEADDRETLDRAVFDELCRGVLSERTRVALRGVLAGAAVS